MRVTGTTLAVCVLFGTMALASPVQAAGSDQPRTRQTVKFASDAPAARQASRSASRSGKARPAQAHATSAGGLSCVPYARMVTGMAITGNGGEWWRNASGLYAR